MPHEGAREWGAAGTSGLAMPPDGCCLTGTKTLYQFWEGASPGDKLPVALGPVLARDIAEMGQGWGMAEPKQGPVLCVEAACKEVPGKPTGDSRPGRCPQGPGAELTSQTRSISLLRNLKHFG